jgi:hypothetical protein
MKTLWYGQPIIWLVRDALNAGYIKEAVKEKRKQRKASLKKLLKYMVTLLITL